MAGKHESDMTRKEKWAQRIKTIKNLKGKARLEYLWTYYRSWLVVAAAIVFVICTGVTMVRNLTQNTVLSIVFVDAVRQPQQAEEKLEQELGKAMGLSGNQKIQVDTSASSADTDDNQAKLTMEISSVSGNDIVICGREVYEKYKNAGAFQDVRGILESGYEKYKPYMTDGELDLSKCPAWTDKKFIIYSPAYVCVLNSSEHRKEVEGFFHAVV